MPRPLVARTGVHIVPAIKEQTEARTPQERYNQTKGKLAQILISEPSSQDRGRLLALANIFGDLFSTNQQAELGPQSLFIQARTFHIMFERFHLVEDAESARNAFLQVATLYPGNTLSDDALYKAAVLTSYCKKKTPSAESLYQKILDQYPQGDYRAKATQQLEKTASTQPQDGQTATGITGGQKKATSLKHSDLAEIAESKFWISDRYSRVIISANRQIPYKINQKDNLLSIDVEQGKIDPKFCREQTFASGLLRQIRTNQTGNSSVRFQLGLQPYDDYKVFTLNDPFRIVVDVYGSQDNLMTPLAQADSSDTHDEKKKLSESVPTLTDHKKRSPTSGGPRIKSSQAHLSLAQQLGLGVKTIVIDPGHGGKDPGAMAFGLKEKDITLKISKKLTEILTKNFHYQIILTRTKDVYIPLEKRTAFANAKKADLFVSIHVNAHPNPTNSGIETYFLNLATDADAMRVAALENASSTHSIGELQDILSSLMNNSKIDESSRLARFVQTNLVKGLGGSKKAYSPKDLGVKQAPFYVLIGAEMPAILAELAFITNPDEASYLKQDSHLETIAQQLAEGIVSYIDHHRAAVSYY